MTDLAEPLPGVAHARTRHLGRGYLLYLAAALLFAVNGTVAKTLLLAGLSDSLRGAWLWFVLASLCYTASMLWRQRVLPIDFHDNLRLVLAIYLFPVANFALYTLITSDFSHRLRETLLTVSSDWPFMVSKDSAADYARYRAHLHAHATREIADALASGRQEVAQRLADGWNRADGLFGALDSRRLPR